MIISDEYKEKNTLTASDEHTSSASIIESVLSSNPNNNSNLKSNPNSNPNSIESLNDKFISYKTYEEYAFFLVFRSSNKNRYIQIYSKEIGRKEYNMKDYTNTHKSNMNRFTLYSKIYKIHRLCQENFLIEFEIKNTSNTYDLYLFNTSKQFIKLIKTNIVNTIPINCNSYILNSITSINESITQYHTTITHNLGLNFNDININTNSNSKPLLKVNFKYNCIYTSKSSITAIGSFKS